MVNDRLYIEAGELSTHSRFENLLAYALHASKYEKEILINFSRTQGIWSHFILKENPLEDYDLPENIKFGASLSRCADERVGICSYGTPGYSLCRKIKNKPSRYIVKFDEGSGSWQSKVALYKIFFREGVKIRGFRYASKKVMRKALSDLNYLLGAPLIQNWSWFASANPLVRNELLVESLKELYSLKLPKKKVCAELVFLTSPWVELGYCSKDYYLKEVYRLIMMLSAGNAIIKPHPGEDLRKYEGMPFEVYRENESIESAVGSGAIITKKVVGEASTALITMHLLFGTESYRHHPIVKAPISGVFKKALSEFVIEI